MWPFSCKNKPFGLYVSQAKSVLIRWLFALLVLTQLCINLSAGDISPVSTDVLKNYLKKTMGKANKEAGVLRIVHKYALYTCSGSVRMLPHGKRVIHAKGDGRSVYDEILIESLDMEGRVRLQSAVLGTYICYSKSGRLKSRDKGKNKRLCEFDRIQDGKFTQFRSRHNRNWYLGFDKFTGKPFHYKRTNPKRLSRECLHFVEHDNSSEEDKPPKGRATPPPSLFKQGDIDDEYIMKMLLDNMSKNSSSNAKR